MKKNLDRLFQEKLKDFEQFPPNKVWEHIEDELDNKKKKRILPFWYYLSGISAAAIALLLILNNNQNTNIDQDSVITDVEKVTPKVKEILKDVKQLEVLEKTKSINDTSKEQVVLANVNQQQNINNNTTITKNNQRLTNTKNNTNLTAQNNFIDISTQKNNPIITQQNNNVSVEKNINNVNVALNGKKQIKVTKNNNLLVDDKKDNKIIEALKQEEVIAQDDEKSNKKLKDIHDVVNPKKEVLEKEELGKKWAVASVFAPVSLSPFEDSGSMINPTFVDNPKTTKTNVSYGLKLNYQINKRLSIQGGVNVLKLSYGNSDVIIEPAVASARTTSIRPPSPQEGISIQDTDLFVSSGSKAQTVVAITEDGTTYDPRTYGELNQQFGYIEIPIEAKYRLNKTDKKLGVNVVGGFSTMILNENSISVKTPDFTSDVGKAENLNDVNFSGNIGVDVDYKLSKNLYFNINPMLKIQTNTFSQNQGNLDPYFIGVYTGLNFSF